MHQQRVQAGTDSQTDISTAQLIEWTITGFESCAVSCSRRHTAAARLGHQQRAEKSRRWNQSDESPHWDVGLQ